MDWIIVGGASSAILIFVLMLVPWRRIKHYFCFNPSVVADDNEETDHPMCDNELDGWNDHRSIAVYYRFITQEYDRYLGTENEIHSRAAMLLTLNGVILTLVMAFIIPTISDHSVLFMFILASSFLFISIFFVLWAVRPAKRMGVSYYSHRDDYRDCQNCNELRKKILTDLLFSIEAQFEICEKKTRRFKWSLYLLFIAICNIFIAFVAHLSF